MYVLNSMWRTHIDVGSPKLKRVAMLRGGGGWVNKCLDDFWKKNLHTAVGVERVLCCAEVHAVLRSTILVSFVDSGSTSFLSCVGCRLLPSFLCCYVSIVI